ncbi:CMRF35-like molecule 7 isoform X2 [Polyodon spathula]|uniref:CMRF35-like molecule 7 isoform X2 n=1 Tax=Polyodon spathula TaxID=7913 RepID=UPI001B7E66B8|nr:CMRF35-like molecule 7 isoform X2 [Polyodon spathula]
MLWTDPCQHFYTFYSTGAPGLSVTSYLITGNEGGSVSFQCYYDRYYDTNVKYWCRGYVWSSCKEIQRSSEKHRDENKVSISDDRTQGIFTVTVRRLEKKDADWYWCGIERVGTDEGILLNLQVADATSTTTTCQPTTEQTSTSDPTSTEAQQPESTSPPADTSDNNQGSQKKEGPERMGTIFTLQLVDSSDCDKWNSSAPPDPYCHLHKKDQ